MPLLLTACPLGSGPGLIGEAGAPDAVVAIRDPLAGRRLRTETTMALFGLTAAEARLAVALSSGESLAAAADRLAVSRNTVRTQLASIFRKTGTRRQADLVRLLSGSAA